MKGITSITYLLCVIISIHGVRTQIFGGSNAPEKKYKYYAYLSASDVIDGVTSETNCGGSVIDNRWILTAAHCFYKYDIAKIEVKLGTVFRSGPTGTIYRVVKGIVHERFTRDVLSYDIALLRVDRDITFDDNVQPVRLANRNTRIGNNKNAIFTGFGLIETRYGKYIDLRVKSSARFFGKYWNKKYYRIFTGLATPVRLQSITLKMYDSEACWQLERHITQAHICTLPNEGKGPCIGDSGGPLVDENDIQVGIDSHSFRPSSTSCGITPEIYIRIPSFRDWIDENIMQN